MLSILDDQNLQIGDAVTQTRAVIGQLAARAQGVRGFVDHAATVTSTLAAHQAALAEGVARLPRLLGLLRTNLAPVDRLARDGGPLLADLRATAPGLTELTSTLPAFTRAGLPALTALGRTAGRGHRRPQRRHAGRAAAGAACLGRARDAAAARRAARRAVTRRVRGAAALFYAARPTRIRLDLDFVDA